MSAEAGTDYVPTSPYDVPPDQRRIDVREDVSRETSPEEDIKREMDAARGVPEPAPDLLDAEAIADSLTGFDEIAIELAFKAPFTKLGGDEFRLLRALYFTHLRRAAGATDKAAWRAAMEIPMRDLRGLFADADNGADPDEDAGSRDRAYAEFVMVSGVPYTFEEYQGLTLAQKNAVYDVARKRK